MANERVLIVDDEHNLRTLFFMLLARQHQGEFYTASRGERALEIVRKLNPDIVLMDIMMPGINGAEALAQMRREGYRGWVVMHTTLAPDSALVEDARRLANEIIWLPLEQDQVRSVFQRALEGVRQMKEGDGDEA